MTGPRLLVIFGSGETGRRAVGVFQDVRARFGRPVTAAVLDSTYAFQENTAELSARLTAFLRDHAGIEADVAGGLSGSVAAVCADVAEADVVFAGPGSPSYALRRWQGTPLPRLLADKLARGGAVVFASAAACTLGTRALPVYEVYKVGEDPRWLPGLDLLSAVGLSAAVVPHFDNREGRNYDTRFCYLGERRLRALEGQLPAGVVILGVDEHTALVCDLEADVGLVRGRGGVTLRDRTGAQTRVAAPAAVPLEELRAWAAGHAGSPPPPMPAPTDAEVDPVDVERAANGGKVVELADALLALESRAQDPQADPLEREGAREALRAGMVRLAREARSGARLREEVLTPLVELLVTMRALARERGDYEQADTVRARLRDLGVDLGDTPTGTTWRYRDQHRRTAPALGE